MSQAVRSSVDMGRHAVVIGGSMAGLLAARVLTNHFDRVTVIDRDQFPDQPGPRKGVPQARHIHQLLIRGKQILEVFFPGLGDELLAAGATLVDVAADLRWLGPGGWSPRFQSGRTTYSCSRDLLEWTVGRRLAANAQIKILAGHEITDLLSNRSKTSVTGVRTRLRDGTGGSVDEGLEVEADLVVDASGRSSRAPQWLEALGYSAPHETHINSFVGYASRTYAPLETDTFDWKVLLIQNRPPTNPRSGGILPLEGGRWIVTLMGAAHDYPPTGEEGFLTFARSLAGPELYEAIKHARPLSPIAGYQRTENRLRHYERLRRLPAGFVALGDAVCAFNPVYGQGMAVSAIGALALDQCLADSGRQRDRAEMGMRFQRTLARVNKGPWLLATGEDFRYPTTEGGQPDLLARMVHRYIDLVMASVMARTDVYLAFVDVVHLLKPPRSLFHPRILAQVLGQAINPLAQPRPAMLAR